MFITKGSVAERIFSEARKGQRTLDCSTDISSVYFVEGSGIFIKMNKNISYVFIKDESVNFTAKIKSSLFTMTVLSVLDHHEACKIEKIDGEGKIIVSDGNTASDIFKFSYSNEGFSLPRPSKSESDVKFTQEQYSKLENNFVVTEGNYFENPKNVETICFAINQGTLYKVLTGSSLYVIDKFDATVDNVSFEQKFGHSKNMFLYPKRIFDFTKDNGEVCITINPEEEAIYIETDDVAVVYHYPNFGTNAFDSYFSNYHKGREIGSLKAIKGISCCINDFCNNAQEDSEDNRLHIVVKNNKVTVNCSEEMSFSCPTDEDDEFELNISLPILNYLLSVSGPEAKICVYEDYLAAIKEGDRYSFFANCEF